MNEIQPTLRAEIADLNITAEITYFELAKRIRAVSEEKLYLSWGHDTLADYCKTELSRSKTWASNMLKAGTFIEENKVELQDLQSTSYARLCQAIRLHPNNPALALSTAITNSEDQIIQESKEKKHGKHPFEKEDYPRCKTCGTPENLHE